MSDPLRFELEVPIRFGDCDPAGIVYYPRYFDLFHQTMESWFDELRWAPQGEPLTYAQFIGGTKLGLPSVDARATFKAPCRFGECVRVSLVVTQVGTSSVGFAYELRGGDDTLRATGSSVAVLMDLDPESPGFRRGRAWPPDLRAAIARYLVAEPRA